MSSYRLMADGDRLWSKHLAPHRSLAAWMSPLAGYLSQATSEREINESLWWVLAGRRKGRRRESRQHYLCSAVGKGKQSTKAEIEGTGTPSWKRGGMQMGWSEMRQVRGRTELSAPLSSPRAYATPILGIYPWSSAMPGSLEAPSYWEGDWNDV